MRKINFLIKGLSFFVFSILTLMLFPSMTLAARGFTLPVNYDVGANPQSVTSGDFDKDGNLDLVVVNSSSNNVSVLLGIGDGTFATPVNYDVGANPQSVTSGDFNKDGYLDLVVTNWNDNNVSILFGADGGTFTTAVNYAVVGNNPYSVTTGDFNKDGYLDLAVTNVSSSSVSILLGVSDGTFATAVNYAVGNFPYSVTTGDFDKDGDLDLVTANISAGNISVLLGNGNGTFFTPAVNHNVGSGSRSLASGDFDGDGNLDLVVLNGGDTNVSILLGSGSGTFATAVNYDVGANPQFVTSGDFDGDGDLDLIVVNSGDNSLSILLGSGSGTFATAVNYDVGANPQFVTSGDFDGDSYLDLAVVNGSTDNVSIIMNIEVDETFPFAGGTGTEEDPFQISTCQQLQNMNFTPDGGVTYPYLSGNYYFILNNDIDCSDTVNWNDGAGFMPIGHTYDYTSEVDYGAVFFGNFDGNNHIISNLYINMPDFTEVGLFGYTGILEEGRRLTIKDLTIANANITALGHVGILSGFPEYTDITNCHTSGQVTSANTSPEDGFVGGIVGIITNSKISNSSSQAQVAGLMAGGIVGGLNDDSSIENSYTTGDVTSAFVAGGLVGYSGGGSIYNSYATGNVTGAVSGGLVSFLMGTQVFNSYSTGDLAYVDSPFIYAMFNVELEHIVGGLVGGFIYSASGDLISTYIHNSGWYKSEANSSFSAVGAYGYQGEGFVQEGSNAEVDYSVTDKTVFYSSSHDIYNQEVANPWGFDGNPWYEYSNDYPKFTEQEQQEETPTTHHRTRSSGSSPSVISSFYKQQIEKAKAAGQDITPYQEALNKLPITNPSTSSGQAHLTLRQGMQGSDVKELQVYLNTHNYPLATAGAGSLGNETTYFGFKTKQAVIKFQKANNLTPDGIVGTLTWKVIDSIK